MIDCEQVEHLLQNTKVNSLTDVIMFIFDHVHKVVSFQPMHEILMRVNELENTKGLDKVMIQEVKTLVEAIFQQKQDMMRRDIEKVVHFNLSNTIEQENTRRSLNQLDFLQMLNTAQQSRKPSSSPEIKVQTLDPLYKEINQLRIQLEKKADRKDFFQLKTSLHKQVSAKMSISETERIVQKFEKEVFEKLNQNAIKLQKIQNNLKKSLAEQAVGIKNQLTETLISQDHTKVIYQKLQKKLRKVNEQTVQKAQSQQDQINMISEKVSSVKKQTLSQFQQLCQLVENLSQDVVVSVGFWLAEEGMIKGKAVSWSRQIMNSNRESYKYENRKSQIMVVKPGWYRIQCGIQGTEGTPLLMINSDYFGQLLKKPVHSQSPTYSFSQVVQIPENRALISIKLENCDSYNQSYLRITKL